jgi:hypothetical protein
MPRIQNLYNCLAKTRMCLLILEEVPEVIHITFPFSHCGCGLAPQHTSLCFWNNVTPGAFCMRILGPAMWGGDQIRTWHAIDQDPKEEFDVPLLLRPTEHGFEQPRYVVDEVSSQYASVRFPNVRVYRSSTDVCVSFSPAMCTVTSRIIILL